MDLVDEEDVALLEIGQHAGEIGGLGEDGARGRLDVGAHGRAEDVGHRGLAEARRAAEQHVVHRLPPPLGGRHAQLEALADLRLPDEVVEAPGTQSQVELRVRAVEGFGYESVGHVRFPCQSRHSNKKARATQARAENGAPGGTRTHMLLKA